TGGAPEGVLAAAALRCLGAEIIGRLRFRSDEERARAKKMGIADESRIYRTEDLASGNDIRFVATGVTDGGLLKGVHFFARGARTHSILLDRLMGKLRFIDTTHFEDIDHPPLIRLECIANRPRARRPCGLLGSRRLALRASRHPSTSRR